MPIDPAAYSFLRGFGVLFDEGPVEALIAEDDARFSRTAAKGIITLRGSVHGRRVGVMASDFRVAGGSFGRQNSARLAAFVRAMEDEGCPILLHLNTLGVRIMEGRTVFSHAFELVPVLSRFAERNLLVTSIQGQCLGLGALLYGLGHYRLAVSGKLVNLTGPEVFRGFFGEAVDFESVASVERQKEKTGLVQEIVPTETELLERVRSLFAFTARSFDPPAESGVQEKSRIDARIHELLGAVGTGACELFAAAKACVRAFLVRRDGATVGVLMNPPGQPNLVGVAALDKYCDALDLFNALRIPVVSFVDTPGADPRVAESDRNIVGALVDVSKRIARYSHGLMGVSIGRCFGGASVLSFPKCFGGTAVFALEGSKVGIMDERIIGSLLARSDRLLREWSEACARQTPDLADMIAEGIVDGVIPESELSCRVEEFLAQVRLQRVSVPRLRTTPSRSRIPIREADVAATRVVGA